MTTVFTCVDNFENMLTCIYVAWASKLNDNDVRLAIEPIYEPSFFCNYCHVDYDEAKSSSVLRTIKERLSDTCYIWFFTVSCSENPEKLDLMYRFLKKAFKIGPGIINMLQDPVISTMMEVRRRVSNEAHLSREFMRFSSIDNKVYIAHFEPKADVITFVAEHFADRMPSEYWIIVDDTRGIAAVHPINEPFYLVILSAEEQNELSKTENISDAFINLWKTYFDSIAIKERENYECQRNHFPLWMRKHVTEFNVS